MSLKSIGDKRQKKWKETDLYKVKEDTSKPKFYVLDMFPYPSGAGLHVGHPKGYIASDTLARKKMLEGFNVLHPMGFDTFGLGTENYAIEHKMKPQDVAKQNIENYIKQLEMFGTTYDRSRSVNTADPEYFKRTQRVFLQMYNHYYDSETNKAEDVKKLELKVESGKLKVPEGLTTEQFLNSQRLAYVDYKPINRCPHCMTGLANEDLDDGKCERCGSEVEQKPMKQRVLRITKYAERLLEGLDTLKREESMKDLERNWIGKSEGTQFKMKVITEEKDKAAWMVIEKSVEPNAIKELLSFGETHIEATDGDRGNFYRILVNKKDEKKFIEFLSKHMKTNDENGKPEYRYADSDGTTNMVVFSGGKTFNTSTEEGCKEAREYGISLSIPEHQVNFSPWTYGPGYKDHANRFEVYTTRIDTVFGMSFVAIAPEHPLVDKITTKKCKKEVEAYKEKAKKKTQLERTELQKEKTGVFSGAYAINPFNNEKVPVFVADYVLANYGTGVVMAVPAHDERDFEFARKYDLPIKQSVAWYSIDDTEVSASRKDKETIKRTNIIPIVKHDKEDKYYVLDRENFGRKSFIIGGVESNETLEEAVVREVKEESGYQNFVIKKQVCFSCYENYFAAHKGVNRMTHANFFLVELQDETFVQPKEDEIKNHKGLWMDTKAIESRLTLPTHKYARNIFLHGERALTEKGILVNSGSFTGLTSEEAIPAMQKRLEEKKIGGKKVNYKMQDRVFSRQRYRGEPFPVLRTGVESGNLKVESGNARKVLLIHGFEGRKDGNWLPRVEQELGKLGYEVYNETLPNPDSPDYDESMEFLLPYFNKLGNDGIVVGHSLGGKLALKLVEQAEQKIGKIILVAPVTKLKKDFKAATKNPEFQDSDMVALGKMYDVKLNFRKIHKNVDHKILLLSSDDPYVSLATKEVVGEQRETIVLDNKGHFQDKQDQEILDAIIGSQTVQQHSAKIIPLSPEDLPLLLPDVDNYEPTGTEEGPLANITDWVNVTLPDGTKAKRETNTMPGRAGSSRYWLRYMDPTNDKALVGKEKEKYRGSVDVYIGGAEHVTRHMIYGRFWQKFLYDIGVVSQEEPFQEYHYVGLIMGEDGRKMSKRRGNVVNPDDIISQFGADTLRTYEMFMGPFDQAIAWNTSGISGVKKFLDKVTALANKCVPLVGKGGGEAGEFCESNETKILLHQTIKKVTENIDEFKFNTAVSQLMILTNHLTDIGTISRGVFEKLVILLSPFAPHLAEELWEQLGNEYSIFTKATRPKYDEKCLVADTITIAVQINGKVRGTICIGQEANEQDVMAAAKVDEKINNRITSEPKKVIYVKGKILNIIV